MRLQKTGVEAELETERGLVHSVIIFHGIGHPKRQLELGEARFWLSHHRFCQVLDRIVAMGSAAPVITFDDGNASDVEIALPELARRKLEAIFFLLTGRLDQSGSLKSTEVTILAQAGHRIGLHGADHVDWRRLDAAGRAREFVDAREELSALAGHPIDTAAAPFGFYDRQTLHDLRRAGFKSLYTSDWGLANTSEFIRPRNCLEGAMGDAALEDALQGRVRLLRQARRVLGISRKRLLPLKVRQ